MLSHFPLKYEEMRHQDQYGVHRQPTPPPASKTALSNVRQELTCDASLDTSLQSVPYDTTVTWSPPRPSFRPAPSRDEFFMLAAARGAPAAVYQDRITEHPGDLIFYHEPDPLAARRSTLSAAEALLPAPQKASPQKDAELDAKSRWKFFPTAWKGPAWPREFTRVHFFTLVTFAALAVPLGIARELSADATAHYFGGPWAQAAVLAPCFALAAHIAHVHAGMLSIAPALLGTIPGPLLLAVVATIYIRGTVGDLANILAAKECKWFEPKARLDLSWQAADRLYDDCLAKRADDAWTAAEKTDRSKKDTETLFKIQDCQKYLQGRRAAPPMTSLWGRLKNALFGRSKEAVDVFDSYADHRAAWSYLERLEGEQQCSGWCKAGRPIWTTQKTKDPCSTVAGMAMKNKVRPLAWRLLAFSVSLIVVALVCIGWLTSNGFIHRK